MYIERNIVARLCNIFCYEKVRMSSLRIVVDLHLAVDNINPLCLLWKCKNISPSHCCWPTFSFQQYKPIVLTVENARISPLRIVVHLHLAVNIINKLCCRGNARICSLCIVNDLHLAFNNINPLCLLWKCKNVLHLYCCWPIFSFQQYKPILFAVQMQECVPFALLLTYI